MALPIFQRTVVNEVGDIIPNAQIEVRLESSGALATVYSDRDGLIELSNPFFADSSGLARFYSNPDEYKITAIGNGQTVEWRYVVIIDTNDVTIIGDNILDINSVADDIADVSTVADNILDVSVVADNIAGLNNIADNMAEILEADTNAATATTQAGVATTQATNAASSATESANSASAATTSEINAATSEANAATSETNSATSEANALVSESNASTSASNAAASESNASASESAASTSASNAATSASNALTSANNSAASATTSVNAKTASEAARDATLAALDSFDDRYLGQKSTEPTVDNDGNPLVTGALFFNTTTNVMMVYDGSEWLAAYASLSGALLTSNNLSDLSNLQDALTNLGLSDALKDSDIGVNVQAYDADIVSDANYVHTDNNYTTAEKNAVATIEPSFPSGTLMLFQQSTAPTGWTKQTTHNDKALRVVSGTVSSGGSSAFSTAFSTPSVTGSVNLNGALSAGNLAVSVSGNINNTTLSTNTIPSHSHGYVRPGRISAANALGGYNIIAYNSGVWSNGTGGVNSTTSNTGNNGSHGHGHNLSGNMTGEPSVGNLAGSLSSSTAAINVQYVDLIIASKD